MLFYIFIAFGAWTGVLGNDDICDKRQHEACELPGDWGVPATEADVDRMCPMLLKNLQCMGDYSKKCRSTDEEYNEKEGYRDNFRKLAEEACQKDSRLHSRLVENIGCLHDVILIDFQSCHKYLEEKSNALFEHMESIAAEKGVNVYDLDIMSPYGCLVSSLETVCLATKSKERCGSDTRDLILELVVRSGFIQMSCSSANEERLAEYIEVLDFELEEKIALNQILSKE